MQPKQLLEWYLEAGVDETIAEKPINRMAARKKKVESETPHAAPSARQSFRVVAPSDAISEARKLADQVKTLKELKEAVRSFEGCALKKTATNTVFADGNPRANVMLIGEAPGSQEDQQGIPFCGPSGMLLDKMFAAIGIDRNNVYISNTLFWRPPGNRQPSKEELAICEPFVQKHIALINPALLIACGGVAVGSLLKKEQGITRLRGHFHEYTNPYLSNPLPIAVLFHPSYLLRQPGQKRLAWHDMLAIREFMDERKIVSPRPE